MFRDNSLMHVIWSEGVQCIFINHTSALLLNIMHAAYIIITSVQFTIHLIKGIKNLFLVHVHCWGFFKNTREVREAFTCSSCYSSTFLLFLINHACLHNSIMHLVCFFISFINNYYNTLFYKVQISIII